MRFPIPERRHALTASLLSSFILALSAASATAADASPKDAGALDRVVVTASRTARTQDQTLAAITVIDRAEIDRLQPQSLQALLAGHAGIALANNGGAGKATSVFLRDDFSVRWAGGGQMALRSDLVPVTGSFDQGFVRDDNVSSEVSLWWTPGPFTFAGGIKISEAEKFNAGLIEIFDKLKGKSEFESVQTKVEEHRGVVLHRLQGKNVPEQANRIFGKDHGLYVGAGNGVVWFAIGGEEGLPTLKRLIDSVTDAPVDDNPVTPAQFVLPNAPLPGSATVVPLAKPTSPSRPSLRSSTRYSVSR